MNDASLVLAIARPLLPSFPPLGDAERKETERDLAAFLEAQLSEMPRYLALPFQLALFGFEWLPLLRYGRRYTALPRETQGRVVRAWADSPIGAMRNFVKLLRTCALFAWLDHPVVAARLESESAEGALETGTSRAD